MLGELAPGLAPGLVLGEANTGDPGVGVKLEPADGADGCAPTPAGPRSKLRSRSLIAGAAVPGCCAGAATAGIRR